MSLRDVIHSALGPTVSMLVREFGEVVIVREQAETREADGSTSYVDRKVAGINEGLRIILMPVTEAEAQRSWGRETEVTMVGMVTDTQPLDPSYRLTVDGGTWDGQVLAIVEQRPDPIGGVTVVGLKKVA